MTTNLSRRTRHAAWWLPGKDIDPRGKRYSIIYTHSEPKAGRIVAGTTLLIPFCCNDAWYPLPEYHNPLVIAWSKAVNDNNWWVRDEDGNKVAGWGHGGAPKRWAVDLSKPDPLEWLFHHGPRIVSTDCSWAHGVHFDDLAHHSPLTSIKHLVDHDEWARMVGLFIDFWMATREAHGLLSGINGGKRWLVHDDRDQEFDVIKLEGFGFEPFGTRYAGEHTWESWVTGAEDKFSAGLLNLKPAVVLEAWYKENWDYAKKGRYARLAFATTLLRDDCCLMYHGHEGAWWKQPEWDWFFQFSLKLGEPVDEQGRTTRAIPVMSTRMWMRRFAGGTVIVNPGPKCGCVIEGKAIEVKAEDAMIV